MSQANVERWMKQAEALDANDITYRELPVAVLLLEAKMVGKYVRRCWQSPDNR